MTTIHSAIACKSFLFTVSFLYELLISLRLYTLAKQRRQNPNNLSSIPVTNGKGEMNGGDGEHCGHSEEEKSLPSWLGFLLEI